MAQTLEAIRGTGGSIKVGTTGTIGALMSRELESIKPATQETPAFDGIVSAPRGVKSKDFLDEASSSGTSNGTKRTSLEGVKKSKHHSRKSQIPMLDSDNVSIDGTPIRQKSDKRISYMVEVVDIKCGNPDKAWASPITNRLKKLGFSKLSEKNIV